MECVQDPGTEKVMEPMILLGGFVRAFSDKGWLGQKVRIRHLDRRYRVFCSGDQFFAFRINDHHGVSPGLPGWIVCLVTNDGIIDDSGMSNFASTEPSAYEWLNCIADGDFELI